jgi:hypothetical protein
MSATNLVCRCGVLGISVKGVGSQSYGIDSV